MRTRNHLSPAPRSLCPELNQYALQAGGRLTAALNAFNIYLVATDSKAIRSFGDETRVCDVNHLRGVELADRAEGL
jgi:hypothetical protein